MLVRLGSLGNRDVTMHDLTINPGARVARPEEHHLHHLHQIRAWDADSPLKRLWGKTPEVPEGDRISRDFGL